MGQWYRVLVPFNSKLQRFPLNYEFDEAAVYRVQEFPTTPQIVALGLIQAIATPAGPSLPPETFMLGDDPEGGETRAADDPGPGPETEPAAEPAAVEEKGEQS